MPRFPVEFVGNLGNNRVFFNSIKNGANETLALITKVNEQMARSTLGINPSRRRGAGTFIDVAAVKDEINAIDNVFKSVTNVGYRLNTIGENGRVIRGDLIPTSQIVTFAGNVKAFEEASIRYSTAVSRLAIARQRTQSTVGSDVNLIQDRAQAISAAYSPRIDVSQATVNSLRTARDDLTSEIRRQRGIAANYAGIVQTNAQAKIVTLEGERVIKRRELNAEQRVLNSLESRYSNALESDTGILQGQNSILTARSRLIARLPFLQGNIGSARDAQLAARSAAPDFPASYKALADLSPSLIKQLNKQGLSTDASTFYNTQQGKVSSITQDISRGTYKASGQYLDNITTKTGQVIGVTKQWSAEIDKGGKVLTRFGGQLSGVGNALNQITRNFQKVIEWTVATTVVFKALQYAINELNTIKELDASLQRFSITAQESPKQSLETFKDLAAIAYSTATPLNELVGAADDIALATQKAGQTSESWKKDILSLTESVGIFTNITGKDTVTSTDLLTASMKQLGLTAQEIPGLLSKITSVAGGQSQAISDITQGLSVMAEAGKQAGLTVDQQIATIQVLSQVTSKTPAEVATSFKNLVGSLGSPGAIKGLEKFNIAVRDQAGNLRNILDVYGEISQKIKSGIIPAADVQGIVRAISGGPRRAPDAAALLSAITQIAAAEQRAANATNEYAIANAKVLDTTQAKFIQLQSAVDAQVFEKFGKSFKDFSNTLLDAITSILNVFKGIPTSAITTLIQLVAFFASVRVGIKVLGGLINFLRETSKAFLGVAQASAIAARAPIPGLRYPPRPVAPVPVVNPPGFLGRASARLGGASFTSLGAGAVVGGLATALSGGNLGQSIGGAAQGLGTSLLFVPEPTGLTKIAAAALFAAGTVAQFVFAEKKATDSIKENSVEVLNSFTAYKEAALTLEELHTRQVDLSETIDSLHNKSGKTVDDYAALNQAQTDYAANILATIAATSKLAEANEALSKSLKPGDIPLFEAAKQRGLNTPEFKKAIQEYQQILLRQTHPNIGLPSDSQTIPAASLGTLQYGTAEDTLSKTFRKLGVQGTKLYDFSKISEITNSALEHLSKAGFTDLLNSMTPNIATFDLLQGKIDQLKESNPELASSLSQTLNAFEATKDSVIQASNALALFESYLAILSQYDPTASGELQKVDAFATGVIAFANQLPAVGGPPVKSGNPTTADILRNRATALLSKAQAEGGLDAEGYKELRAVADAYYDNLLPKQKEHTTRMQFLSTILGGFREHFKELGIDAAAAFEILAEGADEAALKVSQLGDTIRETAVGVIAKAQADFQGGLIGKAERDKIISHQNTLSNAASDVTKTLSTKLLDPGFLQAFDLVKTSITGVTGLLVTQETTADELVAKLFTLADTYGLNDSQLKVLQTQLILFVAKLEDLKKLKVNIPIELTFDKAKIAAAIKVIRDRINSGDKVNDKISASLESQLSALNDLAAIANIFDTINTNNSKGSGTKSSSSAGGGSTPAPGSLDLPKEITSAINESDLVKQAIANAKKLQSQIPGADKAASKDVVALLDGLTVFSTVRGVKEEYLRKALDALAEVERARLAFETKADTLRRIRVGSGDFAGLVNTPLNAQTGVSVGSPQGPIGINLNLNGQLLTPAQFEQLANQIAAALKSAIATG